MTDLVRPIEYYTEKYGLELEGNVRIYNIKFGSHPLGYDRCSLHYLKVNDFEIPEKTSWMQLITELFDYLQSSYPKTEEELLSYLTDWSDKHFISKKKESANWSLANCGYWISHNHTGIHSVWFILDLIKFYIPNPSEFSLKIHVPCENEPEEVKKNFSLIIIENFKKYLLDEGKSQKSIEVILKNISVMNKFLHPINCGHDSFYLIDDITRYQAIKARVFEYIRDRQIYNENQISVANKSLNYLHNFFKN